MAKEVFAAVVPLFPLYCFNTSQNQDEKFIVREKCTKPVAGLGLIISNRRSRQKAKASGKIHWKRPSAKNDDRSHSSPGKSSLEQKLECSL